ncbi:MAG: hypothetical protein O2807_08820, partial [bacterium]|nr:hypothetical protein [bacterium]
LRHSQQAVVQETEVDLSEPERISFTLPPGNGHAPARGLLQEAAASIESFFASHSSWSVKVHFREKAETISAPEASSPAGNRFRKEEETVVQEVVDMFNGQIMNIRSLRARNRNTSGGQ